MFRRRTRDDGETLTLYFATDLHASEVCFRKFVAAAAFYKADLLVLGGDLTGKLVTPIVDRGDGTWDVELHGEARTISGDGLEELERRLADQGVYTSRMDRDRHAELGDDPGKVDALFKELMLERLASWIDHAHAKLGETGVRIITAPGNDDPYEIDDLIRERGGERVLLMEGEVTEIAPGHELLSTGWSNHTPWNTHREFDEPRIREHIDAMAGRLEHPETAIFNIHVPPYDTTLDTAPMLDEDFAVQTSMGNALMQPVGSTAVREALEAHQPLASLHGHVHESGGTVRIGRTVAINAGSEYSDGILHGVLLTVGGGRLVRYQATTG
jgi:Icc-related predicted phosphoesterase